MLQEYYVESVCLLYWKVGAAARNLFMEDCTHYDRKNPTSHTTKSEDLNDSNHGNLWRRSDAEVYSSVVKNDIELYQHATIRFVKEVSQGGGVGGTADLPIPNSDAADGRSHRGRVSPRSFVAKARLSRMKASRVWVLAASGEGGGRDSDLVGVSSHASDSAATLQRACADLRRLRAPLALVEGQDCVP